VSVCLSVSVSVSLIHTPTRARVPNFTASVQIGLGSRGGTVAVTFKQPSQKESDRFTGSVSRIHSPPSSVFAQVSSRRALSQNRFPLCDTPPPPTHPPRNSPLHPPSRPLILPSPALSLPEDMNELTSFHLFRRTHDHN